MTGKGSSANSFNQTPEVKLDPQAVESLDGVSLYDALAEDVPALIARKDRQGRYTFVNRNYADWLGREPAEILGKTNEDFYDSQAAAHSRQVESQVMESGQPMVDFQQTGDGDESRYFSIRRAPIRDQQGTIVGVHVIRWEVTDQKRAERALLDKRDMLQAIMDHLPDFIYVKDRQGRYLVVNEAACKILNAQSVAEVVGKTNIDFLPYDQAKLECADDEQVITTGQPLIGREERMLDQNQNTLWLLTSKLPLHDRNGEVTGLVGIDRNITHLKEAAEQLQAAKNTADHANRAKSDFLANMSHEIRTPMNAIIGLTDLLLETQLTKSQREYLRMVQDSGESLLMLINDILDFSKIESGKLELEASGFDLRECLGDAMKSLGLRAYDKGLELVFEVDQEIPRFLNGDPGRLRQVVVNLVANAIKFTEAGEVLLEVRCLSRSEDQVELSFAVTDTGIGISADKCERIFEEFEQADASTTRRYGGTGLGLAISARLIELMGGRIWVESQIGLGSTFQFEVTLAVDHATQTRYEAEPTVDVSGLKVLVIDDNATNRRILKEMLCNWGMHPVTSSGAALALQSLEDARQEQDPFQLIISDINMPDVDGVTLARQVVDSDLMSSAGMIMLASGVRPDESAQLHEMGVQHLLMKPVKQSELFDAIVSALDRLGMYAAPELPEEVAASSNSESRKLKILLAEDNVVNQKLALGILGNQLGHQVKIANNGREVLERLEDDSFDLILMDVQMPEMDGLTATREIRKREQVSGKSTPIVAMTAHAMKGDREDCLAAGMDDYLAKPIRLQEIANKLSRLFPVEQQETVSDTDGSNPQDSDQPVIVWDDILRSVNGDRGLLREVMAAFVDDAPRLLASAREAADRGDADTLKRSAHSLMGSLLFLNQQQAIELAHRVEKLAGAGNVAAATLVLEDLERHYSAISDRLIHFVEDQAAP